jgi:hypothetical protein
VVLEPGRLQRIDLRSPDAGDIRAEVCSDPDLQFIQRARGRGALRLLVVDRATSAPVAGARFVATWPSAWDNRLGSAAEAEWQTKEVVTDARGAATYCDLPFGSNHAIEVSMVMEDGSRVPVMNVPLTREGITGRIVNIVPR